MTDIREKVLCSEAITPFQRKVYLALLEVPAGEVITYGELARRIGCRSPRAVGQALRRNPFAPEVPCHRVVASDGSPGGYFGAATTKAVEQKRRLLLRERASGCPSVHTELPFDTLSEADSMPDFAPDTLSDLGPNSHR